jgi:ribosome-associated translation inhibitor RaiA
MSGAGGAVEVQVTARGEVPDSAKQLARDEVARLEGYVKGPVMGARVVLTQEDNPRIALPARAEGEVTLPGRTVRARTAGAAMDAAVDDLAERLRDQLRRFVDRLATRQREPAESPPGEWRHGSLPAARPERSFRPPEERRIERRKTFAIAPMTVEEAALELEALDHHFFLFRDADTGADAVLYRRDDGPLGVIDPPGVAPPERAGPPREPSRISQPVDLRTAVREMDELNHRFLFFVNQQTGRGNVIYLRYDGHYGLIEPAA